MEQSFLSAVEAAGRHGRGTWAWSHLLVLHQVSQPEHLGQQPDPYPGLQGNQGEKKMRSTTVSKLFIRVGIIRHSI
jgi:hypothetical protein